MPCIALLLALAASAAPPSAPRVDHVMLGVADLDAGVREFEERTGVAPRYGGEHPRLGTHNAIASLGDGTYVEIIAPRPGTATAPGLEALRTLGHPTPVGWAVAVANVADFR